MIGWRSGSYRGATTLEALQYARLFKQTSPIYAYHTLGRYLANNLEPLSKLKRLITIDEVYFGGWKLSTTETSFGGEQRK